jgi:hypothetical protein
MDIFSVQYGQDPNSVPNDILEEGSDCIQLVKQPRW